MRLKRVSMHSVGHVKAACFRALREVDRRERARTLTEFDSEVLRSAKRLCSGGFREFKVVS